MMLGPVEKINLTDTIIRQLINYIQSDLEIGDRLPSERTLIELLSVGRTSLRESMRGLEMLGYVETRAGEGTFVIQKEADFLRKPIELGLLSNKRTVIEIYEARKVIELGMVPFVISNITDDDLSQCRGFLEKMKEAGIGNYSEFLANDHELHKVIVLSTKNSIIEEVLKLTQRLLEEERKNFTPEESDIKDSVRVHQKILDAYEKRDEQAAMKAVSEHMDLTKIFLKL
jgi:GntR family transcriptional regulator, transcriptional repressor for pyruvate dehydrogenase complex